MMPIRNALLTSFAVFACVVGGANAGAASRQEALLITASQVVNELRQTPDQNVPNWLLDRAYAVAVVPNVVKAALILGGRRGSGAMLVRRDDGTWSGPVFVNLTGGSFGFQWGVQSTDVVLVFTSRQSVEGITGGKVTLGADASVAAGPVGRQTAAATDIGLTAQVYSYSRNKGLFVGVALDGSALTIDNGANSAFYNRPGILASEIMSGAGLNIPPAGTQFVGAIQQSATPAAVSGSAAPAVSSPPPAAPPPREQPENLQTYPMEDPNPGAPPPP